VLASTAAVVGISSGANATIITVTGVVTEVAHTPGPFGDSGWPFPNVAVGDHFSASFPYTDLSGTFFDTDPAPNRFTSNNALGGFSVTSGATTFGETASAHTSVAIQNDGQPPQTPGDSVSMSQQDTGGQFGIAFLLAGGTQPLSSVVLPDGQNLGLLSGWEPVPVCQFSGPLQSGCFWLDYADPSGGTGYFVGKIDVAPVPEPSALLVFGVGLLTIGWAARRRA
jgi:hypothetical protein